jgi:hypothetical protein
LERAHIPITCDHQEINKVDAMEIADKHSGGNGNGAQGNENGTGEKTTNGAESVHHGKKHHNIAPSLGYPWMCMLLGFGVSMITSLSSFMI